MERYEFERWNREFPFLEEALSKLNRSPHQLASIRVRKYDRNVLAMMPATWRSEVHGEKGVYMEGHRYILAITNAGQIINLESPPEGTAKMRPVGSQIEMFSKDVAFIVEFLKHQLEIESTQISVTIYKEVLIDPSHLQHV